MNQTNPLGNGGDTVSAIAILGAISDILPPIAAFLAIVWTAIRIYEWARVRIFKKEQTKLFG